MPVCLTRANPWTSCPPLLSRTPAGLPRGKVFAGPNRRKKCYATTQSETEWPMAKMYVDKIFKQANRAVAEEMLAAMRARFRATLGQAEWMTVRDRAAAQAKLDRMFFQVAYPTFPVNGSAGEGEEEEIYWPSAVTMLDGHLGGDLFTNHMLAARLQIQHMFKYIDVRPNRRAWSQVT